MLRKSIPASHKVSKKEFHGKIIGPGPDDADYDNEYNRSYYGWDDDFDDGGL